jgi:hypothetical protein
LKKSFSNENQGFQTFLLRRIEKKEPAWLQASFSFFSTLEFCNGTNGSKLPFKEKKQVVRLSDRTTAFFQTH